MEKRQKDRKAERQKDRSQVSNEHGLGIIKKNRTLYRPKLHSII
jgi:hypothetical protein